MAKTHEQKTTVAPIWCRPEDRESCADKAAGVATDRVDPGALHYLWNLAEANPSAADYAIAVRKLYDRLTETGADPADIRALLIFQVSLVQVSGWITDKHCALVDKLLPKPPRQKHGRPKGALGNKAYEKRYRLYLDWTYEKTLNPRLTKEQFAKGRLRITDEDLAGEYELDHRAKIDALLQDLKPARMKQLDEGQRGAIETIYPMVVVASRLQLYCIWCAAKRADPALTEKQFVKSHLGLTDERLKAYPRASDLIREHIHYLEQGRELSTQYPEAYDLIRQSCVPRPLASPSQDQRERPTTVKSKRNRSHRA
jgi:hypothetical protein